MTAKIYKPAKAATQSGKARTHGWRLDYEPEEPRVVEPLMGWTASGDMKQQISLTFETQEQAVQYCVKHGIAYQVFEPKEQKRRVMAYADNFVPSRREPWTH